MKITFVLPKLSLAGGIRVVAVYAEQLKKYGHDVFVLSVPPPGPTLKEQLKSLLFGKGWIRRKASEPSKSHFDGRDISYRVLDRYRPVQDTDVPDADVIIATWWETAEWVAALSPQKGAKVYFIQHHEVFDYLDKKRVEATYSLPLHKVTISRWLVNIMAQKYGDRDVSWVPNSVDTQQFNAPIRGKQPTPTIGFLYAKAYWKGCDVILKALKIVAEQIPNLRVIAFGRLPLPDTITLSFPMDYIQDPAQSTIRDIYSACDVWLCGSRIEGFSLPILESMACRCPVVSTMVGGPLDLIQEGVNGFLVPIEDSETLAARLIEVLQLPETRWKAMSEAAYTTAISYTWEDATTKFEAALKTAIKKQASHLRGSYSQVS